MGNLCGQTTTEGDNRGRLADDQVPFKGVNRSALNDNEMKKESKFSAASTPPAAFKSMVDGGEKTDGFTGHAGALWAKIKTHVRNPTMDAMYKDLPTRGPINYEKGSTYEGQFDGDIRRGFGVFTWPSSTPGAKPSVYYGYFEYNKPNGFGAIIHDKGDIYIGEWLNGVAQGRGKYYYSDENTIYDGEWDDDKQHGAGKLLKKQDPDFPVNQKESEDDVVDLYSTIFEGTFDRFRIVGKGKITTYRRLDDFPNINDKNRPADQVEDETPLDIYEGDFYNGKLWGDGKIYFANGNKYIGEFENGKMHGEGQFYWKDGRSYVGEYVKGKKDGQGTFKWADGVEYKGGFKNGKQEGLGVLTTKEGKKKGEWRYGILWMWEEEKERQKANAKSKGIPQIPGADQAQPKHGFLPFLK